MNALALMATLGLDTSNYEKGLKGAGGMAQSFASSFKKVLGGVAIAGGAAVTAAGATVISVVKSAVIAYKEFEQLEGGAALIFGKKGSFEEFASGASESLYQTGQRGEEVKKLQEEINALLGDGEKLAVDGIYGPKTQAALDQYAGKLSSVQKSYETQGSAYDFMMSRADEAYKNVQMSASEYMAQVVGLGAGLKQSLGGDAQAAAELADKIITAEADVVAATGRPMEAVQNAFNGLLRGNYSMLDNLGIGIKASKTGMEEVIQKVNEWNKANGKATKYRMGNLADEQAALVDYIEMVGYAGYAEREALDTLEGSFAATKASWKDMLVEFGRGGDIKKAMGKLVTAGKAAVTNLIPVVKNALTSVGTFVGEVAPVLAKELPGIISEAGPAFLQAVGSLAGSLVANFPAMISSLGGVIKKTIVGDENASWPEVGTAIYNGIKEKFSGGITDLKTILGIAPDASWNEIGLAISNGAKTAVTEGANFVKSLLGIEEGVSWNEIGSAISEGAKTAVTEGTNFIKGLLGIEEGASWSEIGTAISNGAKTAVTEGSNFIKGLLGIEEGASWDEVGGAIGRGARSFLTGTSNFIQDLLGIKEGMSFDEIGSAIESGAKSFVNAGANFVKELLGIDGAPWTEVGDSIVGGIESAWQTYKETMGNIRDLFGGGTDDGENRYKQGYDYFGGKTYTNGTGGGRLKVPVDAEIQDVTYSEEFTGASSGGGRHKLPVEAEVQGVSMADGVEAVLDLAGEISSIETSKIDGTLKSTVQSELDGTSLPEYKVNGDIGGQVQQQLDGTKLPDYVANVSIVYHEGENGGSYGRGRVKQEKNARAMANGRIFNRPTIFGYADGAYQVAGDAGPEAVVGVSSLRDMIRDAVGDQLGAIINGMGALQAGQNQGDLQMVLDSGVLVGQIARGMDKQMGKLATWRGGGRA